MAGLTEHKDEYGHYFKDSKGRLQGEFKSWWHNGKLRQHNQFLNGDFHGECKVWNEDGELTHHEFWVKGKFHRDLINNPVCSDEEKFLIALETGASWLD